MENWDDSRNNLYLNKIINDEKKLNDFLDNAEDIFLKENNLINVKKGRCKKVIFVGDIHGDFDSLNELFKIFKLDNNLFIFLGDYIDRGEDSLKCILYLLQKKIENKNKVILLRGNHETPLINYNYGFYTSLRHAYNEQAMKYFFRFNEIFSILPYVALINKYNILCLHGGIPRKLNGIEDYNNKHHKDLLPTCSILFETLWNDPREKINDWGFLPSTRGGKTFFFGSKVTKKFLLENDIQGIVRGHESFKKGYNFYFKKENKIQGFNGLILSIFTCRDYKGVKPSIGILSDNEIKIKKLS